ncbi:uncharacterized protein LOC110434755 [Sorghum bicolor]|uniref:uncharacterized protein LOC110434755 n=1 Tax=Sorghum bicolor TaxID=4558 RepID=UPI0007F1E442|nr:uncharacterized protein LOC110434755 [Sorghum bicolor]|eukprot:XP_021315152.1 uncharacterized protein LOC110434755 [Sorghum bicolor]
MYVEIFLLFLHHTRLHLILFLHPRCSCRGSCLAFDADACTTPAALPTTSPGGGAQEGPRRRLLCGLPLAAPCLAVAPARICAATWWRRLRGAPPAPPVRPPSGGPCVAPRRCYKPRCRCTLAAGSSLAFHGHGKPHEHHGHDEPTRRRLVRLSLNCGNMIKVLMVAIFVSDKRFSCPSKSYELCVVQANVLVL